MKTRIIFREGWHVPQYEIGKYWQPFLVPIKGKMLMLVFKTLKEAVDFLVEGKANLIQTREKTEKVVWESPELEDRKILT